MPANPYKRRPRRRHHWEATIQRAEAMEQKLREKIAQREALKVPVVAAEGSPETTDKGALPLPPSQ